MVDEDMGFYPAGLMDIVAPEDTAMAKPVGLIGWNEESKLKICKWYKVVPKNVS